MSYPLITPINEAQQEQVIAATGQYIEQASRQLGQPFAVIPVVFDLKGRVAGMYKVKRDRRIIRYNPYLFARYFTDNLTTTVPHEVAHYIVDVLYGIRKTRPHGKEWKDIMTVFKADASVTCDFDLEGIPGKRYQRFEYACMCRIHKLTRIRHNRVLRGVRYKCRSCKNELAVVHG